MAEQKHWSEAAVTDAGAEQLNEMMAGRKLVVTRAVGGSGSVSEEDLRGLTALTEQKQKLTIIEDRSDNEGRTVCVQVTNADAEYQLQQIGLYAHLENFGEDPQPTEDKLLAVIQDRTPVTVPSTEETVAFLLEIYLVIQIDNDGRFEVSVDKTAIVSIDYLNRRLEEHNTDPFAHLLRDDNHEENLFRIGIEDGHEYFVEVSELE